MTDEAFQTRAADRTTAAGRTAAALVVLAALVYAVVAAAPGHSGVGSGALDVFLAGAVPGVLATLILWMSRPARFGRGLRSRMIAISLVAPAVVAYLPHLIAGH